MAINVKTWSGSDSAQIVDMTNAGKRGLTCRVLRFNGWRPYVAQNSDVKVKAALHATDEVIFYLESLDPKTTTLEAVKAVIQYIMGRWDSGDYVRLYEEEIKGVHAPVEKLVASVEGEWSFSADENGICVSDLKDQINMPRMITFQQSDSRAYQLAKKVFADVEKAQTFHEVGDILGRAGCKLHYYCAMD